MRLSGRKKAVGVAIGILMIILLGYRLFWYRPPVAVIMVKKAEIQGKVHGPGTVQSKVGVSVSAKITGISTPATLVGRLVVAVVNLPPKRVAGFQSEVLVLGVPLPSGEVVLLTPDRPVLPGLRVF